MESLYPMLPPKEVNQMNMLALAHVGDAVYELLVRSMLCRVTSLIVSEMMAEVASCWRALVSAVSRESMTVRFVETRRNAAASRITVIRIRLKILVSIPPITRFLNFFMSPASSR